MIHSDIKSAAQAIAMRAAADALAAKEEELRYARAAVRMLALIVFIEALAIIVLGLVVAFA